MYKLLIADDEAIVREGLRDFIDWEQFGFTVSGLFEDGADVIRYLEEHTADVVLADMRMYDVSGLDLAQHIIRHYPNMKFIVLSGYSDFEYVRESLRLGLADYLLKPVDRDELTAAFLRVRASLDADHCSSSSQREVLVAQGRLLTQAIESNIGKADALTAWRDLFSRTPELVCRSAVSDLFQEIHRGLTDVTLPQRLSLSTLLRDLQQPSFDALADWTAARLKELLAPEYVAEDSRPDLAATVERYVTEHLSDDFSVEDLARSLFFSSGYLSREYKRLTGESLACYIIRRRMTLAMSLLKDGALSVAQVAQQCGYRNAHYFQRAFKKYAGLTPREWRVRQENSHE